MKSFILAVSGLSRLNILSLYNTGYSLCSICKAGGLLLNLFPAERAICFSFSQFLYDERYDFTFPKAAEMAALRKRSEEHTSELQSRGHLVCRLLLGKQKNNCDDHGNI